MYGAMRSCVTATLVAVAAIACTGNIGGPVWRTGDTSRPDKPQPGDSMSPGDTTTPPGDTWTPEPGEPPVWIDDVIPSRTSGVAPLAVFFDATGGDHGTVAFHQRGYVWDFGDPASRTWATTGRSKNAARGPFAAHVFETPGTYHVTAYVTDVDNSTAARGATITVEDPDEVFSGDNTICFSTGSDFTGCPSNNRVTVSSFGAGLGHAAPGRRLLFKRGDTFRDGGQTTLDEAGPGIVGAFGSGDLPVIDMTVDGVISLSDSRPAIDDWRIMDLNFVGDGDGFAIHGENRIRRVTMLRLSSSNARMGVRISTSHPDYYGSEIHSEVALVECSFHNMVGSNVYGAFISSEKLMVLGNRIVDIQGHVVRTQHVKQGVYSNNYLARPDALAGVSLKLHAESVGGGHNDPQRPSSHFVITANIFRGHVNQWNVAIGPQGASWDESVHDGILDGNQFIAGSVNELQLHLAGTDTTVRNNIFDVSAATADEDTAIHVTLLGSEPAPNRNRIYNNTCFTPSGGTATCVEVSSTASNTQVHNNLLIAPNAEQHPLSNGSSTTDAGANLALGTSTLVSSSPTDAADFALSDDNDAIDAGRSTGACQIDFAETSRNTDGNGDGTPRPDVGAFEHPGSG